MAAEETEMTWDPAAYHAFRVERSRPFRDLCPLIRIRQGLQVADLGCGTGELTAELADMLPMSTVTGIDSSPEMLAHARERERPGLAFERHEIESFSGEWDLVISHAALHWVEDHARLVPRLLDRLRPHGQLAVQVPANHRHPSHTLILETAGEEPFRGALRGWLRRSPVLEIDRYAELLHRYGGREVTVFEKVYLHSLSEAGAIADWTSGTTLLPYFERLPGELREPFLQRYREKLRRQWPSGPVLYTFRRIFFSAFRR